MKLVIFIVLCVLRPKVRYFLDRPRIIKETRFYFLFFPVYNRLKRANSAHVHHYPLALEPALLPEQHSTLNPDVLLVV